MYAISSSQFFLLTLPICLFCKKPLASLWSIICLLSGFSHMVIFLQWWWNVVGGGIRCIGQKCWDCSLVSFPFSWMRSTSMLFSICVRSNMFTIWDIIFRCLQFVLIFHAGDSNMFFYNKLYNFSVACLSTFKTIKMFYQKYLSLNSKIVSLSFPCVIYTWLLHKWTAFLSRQKLV